MLWWGFSFTSSTHPRHSSSTLFTAHASRTHVKAPQTDLHAKPDNSSGLTRNSPAEKPLRTKTTFQPKTAPKKASRTPTRERSTQAKHGPTPLLAHSVREPGSRPEGQHRYQDGFLLLCSEPWDELRKHQVSSHGSTTQCRSHRGSASIGLGSKPLGIGIGSPRGVQHGSPRSRLA